VTSGEFSKGLATEWSESHGLARIHTDNDGIIFSRLTAEALRDRSPPRPSDTAKNKAPQKRLGLGGDQLADVRDVAFADWAALTG
jgi:hypothetical protein